MIKIGLDIDEVIADFVGAYTARFGEFTCEEEISKNVVSLQNDKNFWTNVEKLNDLDFVPELYCTKRINSNSFTREWMAKHNLPIAPIHQVFEQTGSKGNKIIGKVDVFIDDSIFNFEEIRSKGIPCLLMTCEYNKDYETPYRISDISYSNIVKMYNELF